MCRGDSYQALHGDCGASTILCRVCQVSVRTGAGTDTIVGREENGSTGAHRARGSKRTCLDMMAVTH